MKILLLIMIVMSLISFLMMGYDKRCARLNKWRVSEKALFIVAALMGAVGGVLGMKVFHHKTKHWYFQILFPLMAILQAGAVVYLLIKSL